MPFLGPGLPELPICPLPFLGHGSPEPPHSSPPFSWLWITRIHPIPFLGPGLPEFIPSLFSALDYQNSPFFIPSLFLARDSPFFIRFTLFDPAFLNITNYTHYRISLLETQKQLAPPLYPSSSEVTRRRFLLRQATMSTTRFIFRSETSITMFSVHIEMHLW
jgi:hypothetical protein